MKNLYSFLLMAYLIKLHFPNLNVYIYDMKNNKINNRIYSNYIEYNKIPKNNITINAKL